MSASAYMIEPIYLWHARLEYVNISYINNKQSLDLIFHLDLNNFDECEICTEAKITKKYIFSK